MIEIICNGFNFIVCLNNIHFVNFLILNAEERLITVNDWIHKDYIHRILLLHGYNWKANQTNADVWRAITSIM